MKGPVELTFWNRVSFSMIVLECQGHSVNYAPVAGVSFSEQEEMKGGRLMVMWAIWGRRGMQTGFC
jgi:hypothetical protein